MAYSTNIDDVAQSVLTLLEANANSVGIGLNKVWYGQQELYSNFPCATVIPADTRRTGNAMAMQVELEFDIYIIVIHSLVQVTLAQRTQDDLQMVRDIALLLHQNRTLPNAGSDTVILGTVIQESPRAMRADKNRMMVATQMTFNCKSRGRLGIDV